MKESLTLRKRLGLEINRKLTDNLIKEHPLRQLFWECTLRCNLHCRHCGSDCKKIAGYQDMPKEDFLRVLDNVAAHTDPHKVFVILTGGEPLVRADLEECGRAIYEKGFPWGMVTNGLFLTPERLESLIRAGMHSATVSLDGFKEEHNWMRGHPESFDRAIKAIRMLAALPGFVFDVVTCVNKHNYPYLEELKQYLIGIGLKRWRLFTVFPIGRAAHDAELQLSPEEFRGMLDFIKRTRQSGDIRISYGCEGFLGNYEGDVRDHLFSCQAGITVGSVLIDGSISSCPSIRADYHQGNIYQDEFMEVWENRFLPYRDREWMRTGECASCDYFRYCRGNGMHLRNEKGELLVCHLHKLFTLLSGALVALGFTACDDENNGDYPDDYPLEYGSPSVEYRVKGTVTDEAGNPIENIRVIIRNAWDNTPNPYMDDTVYTDKQGAFANEMNTTGGIGKQKVYFDDIDGEANGGTFQSDSTDLADMESKQVKEGSGNWYQGQYEFTVEKKLKKDTE